MLAVEIMRAHDAGAMGMKIAREDYAKVAAAWKKGGFGSAWSTASDAAAASTRVYGFALVMFSHRHLLHHGLGADDRADAAAGDEREEDELKRGSLSSSVRTAARARLSFVCLRRCRS